MGKGGDLQQCNSPQMVTRQKLITDDETSQNQQSHQKDIHPCVLVLETLTLLSMTIR